MILINLILNSTTRYYSHFNSVIQELSKDLSFDICILTNLPIQDIGNAKLFKKVEAITDVEMMSFFKEASSLITERELLGLPEYEAVLIMHGDSIIHNKKLFSVSSFSKMINSLGPHEVHIAKEAYETFDPSSHFSTKMFVTSAGTMRNIINGYKLTAGKIENINAFFSFQFLRLGLKEVMI